MKKLILIISIVGLANAQFDNVGTSVANFLKIGIGARAEGMGGAFVAHVDDPTALYWNVAGITHAKSPEVVINTTNWIADINYNYLAAVIPAGRVGNFGINIAQLPIDGIMETTELEPGGTGREVQASDFLLGIGFARRVSDQFSVGIQAKYIRESISFSSASAFAVDIGSQYKLDRLGLTIGMAITNFGSKMRMYGTDQLVDVDVNEELEANPKVSGRLETKDWPLPVTVRLGFSSKPLGPNQWIQSSMVEGTINFEYYDPRDFNPYYMAGVELKIMNLLYIRTGTRMNFQKYSDTLDDTTGLTEFNAALDEDFGYVVSPSFGFGLSSKSFPFIPYDFTVDYAVTNMGLLGMVNHLTIQLSL